jgi:hypothetical protein
MSSQRSPWQICSGPRRLQPRCCAGIPCNAHVPCITSGCASRLDNPRFNRNKLKYARGDVHENRAECLFSFLKPYLRVFRGLSKLNLPGYVGFFQFLRHFRHQNALSRLN